MKKIVHLFHEVAAPCPSVLGGKGAGIAEMGSLGLPVPPGFTVTTTVARAYMEHGRLPKRLAWQLKRGISLLEQQTGKKLGDPKNPLLVSVRSGAMVSMPGMMDTILNLGLNPDVVEGLSQKTGGEFAHEIYARFLAMFGEVVLGIKKEWLAASGKPTEDTVRFRQVIQEATGFVPDNPYDQLAMALLAVFRSWNNERAITYRKTQGIPHWWGTACTVQAMVFGNLGESSCTGVVFSHNVATGAKGLYGEFLPNAQGEDIVAGTRTPLPIQEMEKWNKEVFLQLKVLVEKLSAHYDDIVDVEFTVEQGKLYLLQVRRAKRTPEAAATFAVHQVWRGDWWTREMAIKAVPTSDIEKLARPGFNPEAIVGKMPLMVGLPASPGVAVGKVVKNTNAAIEQAAKGVAVILVRPDTSPDDLSGMLVAKAIITATGGLTSHAAVVARSLGVPAVVGAGEIKLVEGQEISVDGATGKVYAGSIPLQSSQQKKEVRNFLRWLKKFKGSRFAEPRIDFEWVEKQTSVNQVLNDFYLADAMATLAQGSSLEVEAEDLRVKIHQTAAEFMACYLTVAVAGELRHSWKYKTSEIKSHLDTLTTFGVSAAPASEDRLPVQKEVSRKLAEVNLESQIKFFETASVVFKRGSWSRGYGGKKWAVIAETVQEFLTGKLPHSVFVDRAFDLRHNGGVLFNKHTMVTNKSNENVLHVQLDIKKRAVGADLFDSLSKLWNNFSPEVLELWERGKQKNIWGNAAAKAA